MKTPTYYFKSMLKAVKKNTGIKRTSLANHKNPPFIPLLYPHSSALKHLANKAPPPYPSCRFMVLSDLHYYNQTQLGAEGEDWQNIVSHDRKLFTLGDEIMQQLITFINNSRLDFVLITGDLTKDGELISHQQMALYLQQIKKKVYVLPGNHDILNPEACSFWGQRKKTAFIGRQEFEDIYKPYGFNNALSRDPASLSYSTLLKRNLMLLCLDTVWPMASDLLTKELIVDGRMDSKTWRWLEKQLIWAKQRDIAVIVAQHHPLLEHWKGEIRFMPEYIIENYYALRNLYLTYGVKMVFVGHFHAQDLSAYHNANRTFYQILTASPISYPCCYRIMQISQNHLKCKTKTIKNLPSYPNPLEFKLLAKAKLQEAVTLGAEENLKRLGVKKRDRELIGHSAANAAQANYKGFDSDHTVPADIMPNKQELGLMGRLAIDSMSYVIKGMWTKGNLYDDNNFNILL